MLKEKLSIERKKAVMITADFTAPTTESYAMAWLRLCNNAREYKDVIWRVENDSGNRVYVWCNPKYKETVIEFLTGIVYYHQEDKGPTSVGKVIEAEDVTVASTGWFDLFRVQEDGGKFIWSTDMVKPTGDLYEAIQSRRHSSDSSMG